MTVLQDQFTTYPRWRDGERPSREASVSETARTFNSKDRSRVRAPATTKRALLERCTCRDPDANLGRRPRCNNPYANAVVTASGLELNSETP